MLGTSTVDGLSDDVLSDDGLIDDGLNERKRPEQRLRKLNRSF